MAGDWWKKVSTGDRLDVQARWYNAVTDSAKAYQDGRSAVDGGPAGRRPEGLILVRNDSGTDVSRFGVLGISGVVFDSTANLVEFQNNAVLSGVTPNASHYGKFVIANESIPKGAIGRAWVHGVCPCLIYVVTEGDLTADVYDGYNSQLRSGAGGAAKILWVHAGTGNQWGIVRLGNPEVVRVRINGYETAPATYFGEISVAGQFTASLGSPPYRPPRSFLSGTDNAIILNRGENVFPSPDNGHALPVARISTGLIVGNTSETPSRFIVEIDVGPRSTLCNITGPLSGGGKYFGGLVSGTGPTSAGDVDPTTSLTSDDYGGTSGTYDAIIINTNEIDRPGIHALDIYTPSTLHFYAGTILRYNVITGLPVIAISAGPKPFDLFAVRVSQTGGTIGDATTLSSWTYTVHSIKNNADNETLGTGIAPNSSFGNGATNPGNKGMAYWDDQKPAAIHLAWVNETMVSTHCV